VTITRSARFAIGCVAAGLMFIPAGCGSSSPDEDFSSPAKAATTPASDSYASGAPGAVASVAPSASVTSASSVSVNATPMKVELFPEMGYVPNVKRPEVGKSGPVTCGSPKDVVSFDLTINGTRTYNGTTLKVESYKGNGVADDDRTSVTVTITNSGDGSPIYALIVNGDQVAPIGEGLDETPVLDIKLESASWGEVKTVTACAIGL
jgi:hypothetical protein